MNDTHGAPEGDGRVRDPHPSRTSGGGPRPAVPPTRRDRREQTRARLLGAAERLWAERGIHGASLDDIAAAAGLTKGAVYSNFAGKTDLLLALLDRFTHDRAATGVLDEFQAVAEGPAPAEPAGNPGLASAAVPAVDGGPEAGAGLAGHGPHAGLVGDAGHATPAGDGDAGKGAGPAAPVEHAGAARVVGQAGPAGHAVPVGHGEAERISRPDVQERARRVALLMVEFWLYGMRDYAAGWRIADWYAERRAHLARELPEVDGASAHDRAALVLAVEIGLPFQHLLDPERVPAHVYSVGLDLLLGER